MEEMKTAEVERVEVGAATIEMQTDETKTVKMNENVVQVRDETPASGTPASPYVNEAYWSNYAEEVPPTVKRFRENFAIFGTSALLFGICFTACFFRARIGISYPVFILAAIVLIQFVGVNLRNIRVETEPVQKTENISENETEEKDARVSKKCGGRVAIPYYIASVLIAITVALTAKPSMHFFSTVAIVLLLEVAFLELLFADTEKGRSFEERCKEVLLLPFVTIANCMTGLLDGFGFLRKMRFFRNQRLKRRLILCRNVMKSALRFWNL